MKTFNIKIEKEDLDVNSKPIFGDSTILEEIEWFNTQIVPHIYKGKLFTILFTFVRSNYKSS